MKPYIENDICLPQGGCRYKPSKCSGQVSEMSRVNQCQCTGQTQYPKPIYVPSTCQCSCAQSCPCQCSCAQSCPSQPLCLCRTSCACPPTPCPPRPCPPTPCPPRPCPPTPCPPRPCPPTPCPPTPCPPRPCPPTPCPPTPCPPMPYPVKGSAHVGTNGATLLVGGTAGIIPIDTVFSKMGCAVCQDNPLQIRGPHTYLVEWSGAVDPLNDPGSATLQLLLDSVPVAGSANSIQTNVGADGLLAISGGAIVTVPTGCHNLELGYETGTLGAEVANINMRIVELY
ncbi:MAG: hypothetical protein ACRDDX_03085 [Cellulosilyticaceae bacterium]